MCLFVKQHFLCSLPFALQVLACLGMCCSTSNANDFSKDEWQKKSQRLSKEIEKAPNNLSLYSQRGDAQFFLSNFDQAVSDYEKMVEIDPKVDIGHWRLGIAYYFAGQHDAGAKQFGKYHKFDQIDRENGIWRFLCQAKTIGVIKARKQLIEYKKQDREPLPAVYEMFRGTLTSKLLLEKIQSSQISDRERNKRLFYSNMYIGFHELSLKNRQAAAPYFKKAAENTWPAQAGYGPNYMQHVCRLQFDLLQKEQAKSK